MALSFSHSVVTFHLSFAYLPDRCSIWSLAIFSKVELCLSCLLCCFLIIRFFARSFNCASSFFLSLSLSSSRSLWYAILVVSDTGKPLRDSQYELPVAVLNERRLCRDSLLLLFSIMPVFQALHAKAEGSDLKRYGETRRAHIRSNNPTIWRISGVFASPFGRELLVTA